MSARETRVPRAVDVMGATYVAWESIDTILVITLIITVI